MNTRLQSTLDEVRALIEANDGLSLDSDYLPPHPGATNEVVFGHQDSQAIVYKRFGDPNRKHHEKKSLLLFAETGLVPRLLPIETDTILVMERLQGKPFYTCEQELEPAQWADLFRQLGAAMAQIVEFAPGAKDASVGHQNISPQEEFFDYRFYSEANLPTYFDTVCDRSLRAFDERHVPHGAALKESICAIRDRREEILSFASFVCMDDFHYNNMIVDGIELQGFIDLEMTRYGNEVLALAAFLSSVPQRQMDRWTWFREGYEAGRRRPLEPRLVHLAATAAPFTNWIRFSWYWSTDNLPQWAIDRKQRPKTIEAIEGTIETMRGMGLA
jgi:hypothetical protein